MDIKGLLKGVAVVIDDEIEEKKSKISLIINELEKNNIIFLKYKDLPDNDILESFQNVSFILLDWNLIPSISSHVQGEVTGSSEVITSNISEDHSSKIEFIKKLQNTAFIPLFIFSKDEPEAIKNTLVENGLYKNGETNYIFVKYKDELISTNSDNKLFNEIENWLMKTPSIYILKEWEKSLNKSKKELFWNFYHINHKWPSILKKSYTLDGSDVNFELGNFIFKNIMARTEPIQFDDEILSVDDKELSEKVIRQVLEAEKFLKNDSLPDMPFTGDLYKINKYEISKGDTSEGYFYYLNIRPECDIAVRSGNNNPYLYCLKCEVVDEKNINSDNDKKILFERGALIEKSVNTYIPFIDSGKIFVVKFKDLKIFKWKHELLPKKDMNTKRRFKDTRIGRILPPYITAVQQKYSFYLQRQGLPAIPEEAIVKKE